MRALLVSLVFAYSLLEPLQFVHGEGAVVFVSAFASGEKGAIHAFEFDAKTGALTPIHRTTDVQNPFFIAVSPDKQFLYAVNAERFGGKGDESVRAYKIEGHSGRLMKLNEQSSRGTACCYLSVDATGRTVLAANYSSGSVASLPASADGTLSVAVSIDQHVGSGLDPVRQKGPNAHSIVVSLNNRFVLSADLGIDKILVYQLDAATSKLTPHETQPFVKMRPGSGPRHIEFSPGGDHVYVISELSETITVFDFEPSTGLLTEKQALSTLPEDFKGKSYCADVKASPDGHFLYGTNRGHDSIAAYRVNEDGRLTLLAIIPSGGKGPQNLLITPDSRWLLCANMPGNLVTVFRIDPSSGSLTSAGETAMPMPSCIRWCP